MEAIEQPRQEQRDGAGHTATGEQRERHSDGHRHVVEDDEAEREEQRSNDAADQRPGDHLLGDEAADRHTDGQTPDGQGFGLGANGVGHVDDRRQEERELHRAGELFLRGADEPG